jgi:hypothetical protein
MEVAGSIQQGLDPILTAVNEQRRPTQAELAGWQKLLTNSRRYVQKMEPVQQSQFFLSDAWVSYFTGNIEMAHKNAVLAWNKDQTSGDALLTQITMALAANKKPMLPRPPKPQKNRTNQDPMTPGAPGMPGMPVMGPGMPGMPMDPAMQDPSQIIPQGKLTFDYKTLLLSAVGKKIDAQNFDCLNGTTLSYQPGQEAICILAWRNYDPNTASSEPNIPANQPNPGMPMMPGMPGMPGMEIYGGYGQDAGAGGAIGAFAKLFQRGLASGQIKFVGLNLDSADHKNDIIDHLVKSPSPWAQVMAAEQKQELPVDTDNVRLNMPVLVMADKTGAVRYAGPATGFIAPVLLGELGSIKLGNNTHTASGNLTPAADPNPQPEPAAEPAVQPAPVAPPAAAPTTQYRELSEEEQIRAEQLLGPTRDLFMKTGRKHITTYKNGVEMCRKIMRDFPETKYAHEAQILLRQVPENKREQYGITDQELGL